MPDISDAVTTLLTLELHYEQDVVSARQRTRQIAELLGFAPQDQTRITTAVSEIARNAYEYAGGGRVEFSLRQTPKQTLCVRISDRGPGIAALQDVLQGQYVSKVGMGLGILGARRLSDRFHIRSAPGAGTTVEIEKDLPSLSLSRTPDPTRIVRELARLTPQSPFEEVRRQNQELMQALDALQARQNELDELNGELTDTNRGVMALYAELDEKNKELQRASEMKSRFLSHMSHELRTPLNSIMGLAQLLIERADGPLTSEQEKQVTFVYRSAQGLAEIVNDLLDTAKIESGTVTVQTQEFTIEELFSSLRGVFRPLVSATGNVTLTFEESPDLPSLRTDEGKVTQILRNFISNALKFTEQGSVRVSAEAVSPDTVQFAVTDTGIGISEEDLPRIFQDYVQVEGAIQRRVKGTGLGLALARRLAELLGGKVSVSSQLGVGSTFRLTLPICYTEPTTSASSTAAFHG